VVVIHEIFGRQPEIDRVVQRFADAGYAAVGPDLFSAPSRFRCMRQTMTAMRTGEGPAVDQARAVRAWLCENAGLPTENVGIIGFCFGGGFAMAVGRGWGAVSANYGAVPSPEALRGIGPTIACYGGRDLPFRKAPVTLGRRLERLGVPHEIHVFPEVGHSFLTDGHHPVASFFSNALLRVGHDPVVAEEAFGRIFSFFDRHLPGGSA
jgi:carboxymethylenebutenolidase